MKKKKNYKVITKNKIKNQGELSLMVKHVTFNHFYVSSNLIALTYI